MQRDKTPPDKMGGFRVHGGMRDGPDNNMMPRQGFPDGMRRDVPRGRSRPRSRSRSRGRDNDRGAGAGGSVASREDRKRGPTDGGSAGRQPEKRARPADWNCPACDSCVFGSKSACFKCGTPKPASGTVGPAVYSAKVHLQDPRLAQIARDLNSFSSVPEVLRVVAQQVHEFDAICSSNAIRKILLLKPRGQPDREVGQALRQLEHRCLQHAQAGEFGTRDLAGIIHSVVKSRSKFLYHTPMMDALEAQCVKCFQNAEPQLVANVLWAYGRLMMSCCMSCRYLYDSICLYTK